MQSPRFQNMRSRFSPSGLRTSFRRISSASSRSTSSNASYASNASSTAETINSVILRQPSMLNMEAERRIFGSELSLLEPRPIVYWGGVEERMGSF